MSVPKDVQAEYQSIIQKYKAQSQSQQGGYRGREQEGAAGNSGLEMVSALRKLSSAAKVGQVLCLSVLQYYIFFSLDRRGLHPIIFKLFAFLSCCSISLLLCDFFSRLITQRTSPLVVFVWYRDTARLLAEALQAPPSQPHEAVDMVLTTEEAVAGIIRCGVVTGDIVKQSVSCLLACLTCACSCHICVALIE